MTEGIIPLTISQEARHNMSVLGGATTSELQEFKGFVSGFINGVKNVHRKYLSNMERIEIIRADKWLDDKCKKIAIKAYLEDLR